MREVLPVAVQSRIAQHGSGCRSRDGRAGKGEQCKNSSHNDPLLHTMFLRLKFVPANRINHNRRETGTATRIGKCACSSLQCAGFPLAEDQSTITGIGEGTQAARGSATVATPAIKYSIYCGLRRAEKARRLDRVGSVETARATRSQ